MNLTIYKTFTFEASHVLPKHPGQCSRLHGHSWKLTVGVSGPVDSETGFVCDYGALSELVKAHIIQRVDHQHLGQGPVDCNAHIPNRHLTQGAVFGSDFYPSSENLVAVFVAILKPLIPELGLPTLVDNESKIVREQTHNLEEVSLDETCTCRCTWRRSDG